MNFLLIGLAALAGLSNPIQSAANAGLNKSLGQLVAVALAIYGIALVALLLVSPFFGLSLRDLPARAAGAPWWAWVGGLCNLLFVIAGALATKQVGSAVFTVTVTSCAIVLSVVLDQFGLLGLEHHSISVLRLVGAAMAIGGVALVAAS